MVGASFNKFMLCNQKKVKKKLKHNDQKRVGELLQLTSFPEPLPRLDCVVKSPMVMPAVLRVICLYNEPNLSHPWMVKQRRRVSSGVVIEGRKVLTSADAVKNQISVILEKHSIGGRYSATVLAIGTECNAALLTVSDDEFWEGVKPVNFGDLPSLGDRVIVADCARGLSVARGSVSHIVELPYPKGLLMGLHVQVRIPISRGSSASPVFDDKDRCIGIAFQSKNGVTVIPTPILRHFFCDYERNGAYTGFPVISLEWMKSSEDLRIMMGMRHGQQGVLITRIEPTAPPEYQVLKLHDVILSFAGIDVANDGTVPFGDAGGRIDLRCLISSEYYVGECALLKILHNFQVEEVTIKLTTCNPPLPADAGRPSYYIIGGLVFTSAGEPFHNGSEVLSAEVNFLYEDIGDIKCDKVLAFNGKPVENLKHLANMVESCDEKFFKFMLEGNKKVVLEARAARNSTPDILRKYNVSSAMSSDLSAN
ncbi:protease Do-like 9 isoform X2 [Cornus florida]|uniref:protease Do-like 9 isoform X2 n=1 Tax=Cornus florida TaxID=4283 RepID=UPI00289D89AA|nr:protease Do-like 9 isoform X2 [Cornus florida]